jgi:quercetin dioxygenase-like cupin family protein
MEVQDWDRVPVEQLTDKIRRQLVTGENQMMARVLLDKGAVVHVHSHESEQVTYIMEGAMRLFIGEPPAEFVLRAGQFIVIPPNVPHRAEVLEDTVDIDFFSPIRQDWLDGTDTYFQDEA